MAGTTRQQKYARLLQKEISDIFQRDKKGILENAFVTVAEVRVSPDLSVAKIYLTMMLEKDKAAILERINGRKSEIRKALGNSIGKHVRIVPEIIFYIDEVEEKASRLEKLIDDLHIPPADPDDDSSSNK
jgi:ribosome-binding factor A